LTNYSTDGLTPTVNFTQKQTALGGTIPRLPNTTAVLYRYESGGLKPVTSGFVALPGAGSSH
jgi:hypothetical protein